MSKSPPANSQREQGKRARTTRILEATAQILATDGYSALNMSDIAAAAEVTPPTIFNLIGRKEDLLLALSSAALEQLQSAMDAPPTAPTAEEIAQVLDAYTDVLGHDEPMYRALHIALETLQHQGSSASKVSGRFREAGVLLTQTLKPLVVHPRSGSGSRSAARAAPAAPQGSGPRRVRPG